MQYISRSCAPKIWQLLSRFFLVAFLALAFSACNKSEGLSEKQIKTQVPVTSQEEFLQTVENSRKLATAWFLAAFQDKGVFQYQYDPIKDIYSTQNNPIRQLMASRLLAEMSQADSLLQKMHRKNMQFIFTNWYSETQEGLGYIDFNGSSKLGANAMALRTIVFSPFASEYSDQAQKLAEGILSLMNPDGSLEPWFLTPSYTYDHDYLLTFYSGEAILSLVEYGSLPGNEHYLEAAEKAEAFYIEQYVAKMTDNYYPAYVPWHTLTLSKLYKLTGEKKYADAIFILNDKLLELQDTTSQIGRFYNPKTPQYGSPHAASDGVYTEGLAYAYEAAKITDDTFHQEKYFQALQLAVHNLAKLQYTEANMPIRFSLEASEKALGGIPARRGTYMVRIDNVQHTLDAYRKIQEVF